MSVILNSSPITPFTTVVPAAIGGVPGVIKAPITGALLVVAACTSPITAQFNTGSQFPIAAGFSIPGTFTNIILTNSTPNAVAVTLYACASGVNYFGSGIATDHSSFSVGSFDGALAANATKAIPGNLNGNQRKQIVITNLDINGPNNCLITDANGLAIGVAVANIPWTVPTDGYIILKAAFGAISRILVGELYYV